jgi:vesicle coat complex subunit
MAFFETGKRG